MADPRRFEGAGVIVTGGAQGIGEGIVRRLVGEGARVAVGDLDPGPLDALRDELGDAVVVVPTDVTVEAQVEALVGSAIDDFGRLDAAFNVAGGNIAPAPIIDSDDRSWDATVDLCLKAVMLSIKHEARAMIGLGSPGAIVNMASLNSVAPMAGGAAYSSAKAGVEMLTRCAALELAADRIRVNAVSPGLIDTRMSASLRDTPGLLEAFLGRIPLDRTGSPDDVAGAALFLAGPDAGYVTGTNLLVDGGWALTTFPDLSGFK